MNIPFEVFLTSVILGIGLGWLLRDAYDMWWDWWVERYMRKHR